MSCVDWSDAEGLFDMLLEYVADAKIEAYGNASRWKFLENLLAELTAAQKSAAEDIHATLAELRRITETIDPEFADDPVVEHLTACAEELERLAETPGTMEP